MKVNKRLFYFIFLMYNIMSGCKLGWNNKIPPLAPIHSELKKGPL